MNASEIHGNVDTQINKLGDSTIQLIIHGDHYNCDLKKHLTSILVSKKENPNQHFRCIGDHRFGVSILEFID